MTRCKILMKPILGPLRLQTLGFLISVTSGHFTFLLSITFVTAISLNVKISIIFTEEHYSNLILYPLV